MSASSTALTILRRKQVEARTGLARSTIYDRLRNDPAFPKPVSIGARSVGWIESEVQQYLDSLIAKSRKA